MRALLFAGGVVALAALLTPPPVQAQQPVQANGDRPNVFFDCDGRNCRDEYYRTEIAWVNWVRDRQDSDIHLIMTSQTTGAGGREYQLDLIGMGDYEGYEDQLRVSTLPTDTEREQLDVITNGLAVGMARFAVEGGFTGIVTLQAAEGVGFDPAERVVSSQEVIDPWNLWVFRINGNATFDGEETRRNRRGFASFNASRVSPTWKMNFNGNVNYNQRETDIVPSEGDPYTFTDTNTDWGVTQLIAYSVAEHWSVGFTSQQRRMRAVNQDLTLELSPAVEYSIFPYQEATRRALTLFYTIGPTYRDYINETIFGETDEVRFEQSLELELSQRQTWGDASLTLRGSHYLHAVDSLYNVSARGDIDFRITRGFSINMRGDIAKVRDQIYLSAGGASTEEQLLNLIRRSQDFNWSINIGFSFQFGSIFNNVVNNRFQGIPGFFGGGFGGFGGGGGGPGGGRGGGFGGQ